MIRWLLLVLLLAAPASASAEPAATPAPQAPVVSDLKFSAHVDRTEMEAGTQFTLTLSLEGQFQGAELQPIELPKGFVALAQSQASNVSVRAGLITKTLTLSYVLVAQEPGTFQLGPFQVRQNGQPVLTDPIAVTVKKPVLPPGLQPQERFTL